MRKRQRILCGAATAAAALIAGLATTPASATLIPPPPVFDNQQDGLYITNGPTIVLYVALTEESESFFSNTSIQAPTGFTSATIYLTDAFAPTCTPDPATFSLGDCSDGVTLAKDPVTKDLNVSFVSNGATADELTQFFNGASSNSSFLGENGDWQDMSSTFGQQAGFAFVQSDADLGGEGGPTPFPEPISVSLFGAGLLGLWAVCRRRASRAV